MRIRKRFTFTIPDFGAAKHKNIYDWFWNEENYCIWFEIKELVTIQPESEQATPVEGSLFAGKTIVVTGKVEPYTREEVHRFIEALGAKVSTSVSSKTNYLICGEKAGSKLEKARTLGVTVLSPEQFYSLAGAA